MNIGDYLLIDLRLHTFDPGDLHQRSRSQDDAIVQNYYHALNNRFAFGGIERVTNLDYEDVKDNFEIETSFNHTVIPGAVNVETKLNLPKKPRLYLRRGRQRVGCRRLNLAFTTLYHLDSAVAWLKDRGFALAWKKPLKRKALLLLQRLK